MPFETFQRQRQRPTDDPALTIQKGGILSLNLAAYNALGSPDAVELLFDREQQLVGLRKVDPTVGHSYAVRGLGRGNAPTTWLISGKAFTQYYGITADTARRWTARIEPQENFMEAPLLVIDLKEEGIETVGQSRKRQKGATATAT